MPIILCGLVQIALASIVIAIAVVACSDGDPVGFKVRVIPDRPSLMVDGGGCPPGGTCELMNSSEREQL